MVSQYLTDFVFSNKVEKSEPQIKDDFID